MKQIKKNSLRENLSVNHSSHMKSKITRHSKLTINDEINGNEASTKISSSKQYIAMLLCVGFLF